MPWKNATPMTERLSFIGLYHARLYSMTELCFRFGISRKTGYKWLERYHSEGSAGLEERSRSPKHIPQRFARIHRSTIVNLRRIRELHPYFNREYIVVLKNGTELKLSRTYRDRLELQFGGPL